MAKQINISVTTSDDSGPDGYGIIEILVSPEIE